MNTKPTILTPNQQAIWLEAKLHEDAPIFNIGTYAQLNGIPDKGVLEQAIKNVIAENDALRLRIGNSSTEPEQFFDESRAFELKTAAFDSVEKAMIWMNQDFTKSIEIHDLPLYSISLVIAGTESFLYFKHHHIFIDGWSRAQLVQKIAEHYNALQSNTSVDTSSSYKSYVESFNRSDDELEQSLEFWEKEFDGYNRVSTFSKKDSKLRFTPSKRKRFAVSQDDFNTISFNGKSDLKAKFYFLLASLYVTLSRSTGNEEVVIGVPLLNRFDETQKSTIGYYVGLIPLRLKFESNTPFWKIVEGIQSKMKATIPHRNVAIHEINKSVGINFSNSTQLFDVVFSFEPHNHDCNFGDLEVIHSGTFSSDFEQNPLVIHVQNFNAKDNINFEFDYNLNYLNELEVTDLIERYDQVIRQCNTDKDISMSDLSILLPEEETTLKAFSTGIQEDRINLSLVEQIEATAAKYPNRNILHDESSSLTYSGLIHRARQIAGNLISKGIQPEDSVGIIAPRNINTVVSVVGVLMSGARYVPIDPEIPDERLNYMVEIAEIKALVYDSSVTRPPSLSQVENLDLIQLNDVTGFTLPKVPHDHPAYVIFTSGTTGKPKGVCINQDSMTNLVQFLNNHVYAPYGEHLRLAHISSFNFDQSGQHMFASLILGHELVIVSENARRDGKLLAQYLTDFQIDVCDGIPTQLSSMLTRVPYIPEDFNVKHFIIGGEAFTPELARQLFTWSKGRNISVTNAYGPTESTVFSMYYTFNDNNYQQYPDIAIGKPIRNTNIWVLDQNGNLLPPGVKGELCIGGAGLATEYVNREDLTNDKFKFNTQLNERLYHTGDVARWNKDGELFYHGRSDNQVKIKGYRIELSEIEFWLNEIEGVDQGVVLVKRKQNQNYAFGFVQSDSIRDPKSVKNELSKHLPDYMVPQMIFILDEMPLTKTGKFDRTTLLSMTDSIDHSIENVPSTPLEKQLAEIMSRILEVEKVDASESFFAQGGDSLSLVFFLAEIEKELDVSLSMTEFATMNSVQAIAEMIETEHIDEREPISLEDEIKIVEALNAIPNPDQNHNNQIALLTGGTGFVGAFLLNELLNKYDRVFCLTRGKNKREATYRLLESLGQYQLFTPEKLNKLEALQGNLNANRLGLDDYDYNRVINNVDVIYHCGAMVNFIKDFEAMKKANVNSTLELLKISKSTKAKQFNYISTMGIFSERDTTFEETASFEHQLHYKDRGYESTKWIAEGLIQKARDYGINSNVFRLGRITGDRFKGVARYEDFFHRFIEGCLQLRVFPTEILELSTDLTPVDITATSIVELSQQSTNGVYHILNEKEATYKSMLKSFETEGIHFKISSYDDWLKEVEVLNVKDQSNPLFLITPLLKQKTWFSVYQNVLNNRQTTEYMKLEGIEWPEGNQLWDVYVRNCIRRSGIILDSINNSN